MLFRRELIRVLFMLHEFSASLVCSPPCRLFLVVWRTYIDGFVGWWDDMSRLHGDVSTSGASSVHPCVLRGLYCSVVGKGTDMSHLPKTDETNRDLDSLGRFHHFILDLVLICLWKEKTSAAGFEPARGDPIRFQVWRLNHSAKLTQIISFYASFKNSVLSGEATNNPTRGVKD